ncbi:hypothetical protein TNCV_3085431 [Trichonephila clavipes]|nr:hypothetical protein TNCV_3085431 [Trichonephila clavipes]
MLLSYIGEELLHHRKCGLFFLEISYVVGCNQAILMRFLIDTGDNDWSTAWIAPASLHNYMLEQVYCTHVDDGSVTSGTISQ